MNLKNLMDKYNKIIDNLFIGNYESPIDLKFLKDNNIRLIINCTKSYSYEVLDNVQMMRLPITDFNSPENNIILAHSIDKILEIIDLYLECKEGVLVHCHMGQQRSALIVVCYLMKYKKMNLEDSIKEVKFKRKYTFIPEITFEDFLIYYQNVEK
jgi:protein-tyrosine phosphatase